MCEPVSIAMALTAAISAAGALKSGNDQAKVAKYNARVAEANAKQEQMIAAVEEQRQRIQNERFFSSQRAALGASGREVDQGSALTLQATAARDLELEALDKRFGGELRARGLLQQADAFRFQGRQAQSAGRFNAATILIGSGGRIAANENLFNSGGGSVVGGQPMPVTGPGLL